MAKKKGNDKKDPKKEKGGGNTDERKNTSKVLNNDYDNVEWYEEGMSFQVDEDFEQGEDVESDVDRKIIYDEVVSYLEGTRFNALNEQKEDGSFYDLSKSDINEVFDYICAKMERGMKIEALYVLSDHFDVRQNKFYESLSSEHKEDLLNELKERGYIPEDSFRGTLF